MRFEFPDNSKSCFELRIQRVPEGVLIFSTDLTSQKKAEEALNESIERLMLSQKLAKIGSYLLDLRNNKLSWSAEMFTIMGFDPNKDEPTYDHVKTIIHSEDRYILETKLEQAIKTKRCSSMNIEL